MRTLNRCQCGAKPAIVEVPGPKPIRPRMGQMRQNVRERAVCAFCGNATGIHHNRKALRREWNSAGWCGQSEWRGLKPEAGGRRSEVVIVTVPRVVLDPLCAFASPGYICGFMRVGGKRCSKPMGECEHQRKPRSRKAVAV